MGAESVRVLATSAAREAANGDELAAAIAEGGLELEIIDGLTEAELVLRGVRSLPDLAEGPLAIIDVGGGSTELLVADATALRLQHSFALGTVRWLESFPVSDRDQLVLSAVHDQYRALGLLQILLRVVAKARQPPGW